MGPDDLASALTDAPDEPLRPNEIANKLVIAGYGECIDFLDSFRSTAQYLYSAFGDGTLAPIRKIAQLLRWRFFFFQSQTPTFNSFLEKYIDSVGVSSDSAVLFRSHVSSVCRYWIDNQEPLMAYAAG
jgi:hypothetical protein